MTVLAKIIALSIVIKGVLLAAAPSVVLTAAKGFKELEDGSRRSIGAVLAAAGIVLLFLSRGILTVPLVHWVVAVSGIFFVLEGIMLLAIPGPAAGLAEWLYAEKVVDRIMGLLLSVAGIVLFIIL